MRYINFILILGVGFLFLDDRYYGRLDDQSFFTQFQDISTWIVILYLILIEYFMFKIIDWNRRRSLIIITFTLFLPLMYVFYEFFMLIKFCFITDFFCNDIFPPINLTYLSNGIISVGIILNLIYLFIRFRLARRNLVD